ncbi:MAG: adenine nucleotide alpha hydrolase family protein [Anaerolineales bacterium]|nr:adenine nucleotide alpha hydrolase family protein [Anaerolineales bacterium]
MKCRKCGERAAINMRQHKLALCRAHFLEWLPEQTEKAIAHYRMFAHGDRILVAVSGGKDSLALWDVLCRLGYAADGLYIDLGIDEGTAHSSKSRALCEEFAAARGVPLKVVSVAEEYGASIPEAARRTLRGRRKPCAVCGMVKRHIMNRISREGGYAAVATGHNLDDEAAVLLHNAMIWAGGYLARQAPVLPATRPGLARKVKPFCRMYERETAAYALMTPIEYLYEECPFSEGSSTLYYKNLLNRMEEDRPGAKLQFYLAFLQAKEQGLFAPGASGDADLHECEKCGQPTSAPGKCAFCRLWDTLTPQPPLPADAGRGGVKE